MENGEKRLTLEACRIYFFHNRYSVLATTREQLTEAFNTKYWLEELNKAVTNNKILSNVEASFADIYENLSQENLCVGEYNMSSMLELLKEEISVLSKDYEDVIGELTKIATEYYNATDQSLGLYNQYKNQEHPSYPHGASHGGKF